MSVQIYRVRGARGAHKCVDPLALAVDVHELLARVVRGVALEDLLERRVVLQ